MSGDDPRVLAGRFADALEQLQGAWGVEYVPSGGVEGMPAVAPAASARSAAAQPAKQAPAVSKEAAAALRSQASSWSPATKLEYLRQKNVGDCRRCPLAQTRKSIVFGVGSPTASIMFVGEAPGADEDRQGEPFVGRAGQRLDAWLTELGIARADVYIANVLKCRPPDNRDPGADEIAQCLPFLNRQIAAVAPDAIVTLGKFAAVALLGRPVAITRERGVWFDYQGVPLMPTLHPAYLLRNESAKREVWADLKSVMKHLGMSR